MKGHNSWAAIVPMLIFFVFAFVMNLSMYIYENITPEEEELIKYPYMTEFVVNRASYRGIKHDLDTGYYSFAFTSNIMEPQEYFNAIHEKVTSNGWKRLSQSEASVIYQRPSILYPADKGMQQVTIKWDSNRKEYQYIEKRI